MTAFRIVYIYPSIIVPYEPSTFYCFICTCLSKQIYPIVRFSEWKDDGMEGNLIGRD